MIEKSYLTEPYLDCGGYTWPLSTVSIEKSVSAPKVLNFIENLKGSCISALWTEKASPKEVWESECAESVHTRCGSIRVHRPRGCGRP